MFFLTRSPLYQKPMMKKFRPFLIFIIFTFIISCVPGSDDEFDEINAGRFPLSSGNKWTYDIVCGSEQFIDSAEILDEAAYYTDELSLKYLSQYKNIALTSEELASDTVRIKLLAYESDILLHYGNENRDRTQSHFIYGTSDIFEYPKTILDHSNPAAGLLFSDDEGYILSITGEKFYTDSLILITGNTSRVVRDTTLDCIKTRNVRYSGSTDSGEPSYDLYHYYTGLGIVMFEGVVNGSSFKAELKKCELK